MEISRYRSNNKQRHRILSIKITYHPGGTTARFSFSHILHSEEAPEDRWPRVSFLTWIKFASFVFITSVLTMGQLQYKIGLLGERKTSLVVQSYQGTLTVLLYFSYGEQIGPIDVTNFTTNIRYVLSGRDQVVFSSLQAPPQLRKTCFFSSWPHFILNCFLVNHNNHLLTNSAK